MAVSKRIQVLLRDRIAELVEGLAECEGVSVSRLCGGLIEEALKARGPLTLDGQLHARGHAQEVSVEELGLDIQTIAPKPEPEPEPQRDVVTPQEQPSAIDDDDLRLLKKLKMLKELGLL